MKLQILVADSGTRSDRNLNRLSSVLEDTDFSISRYTTNLNEAVRLVLSRQFDILLCINRALEMSQNSERLSWSFAEVDSKLKDIMENVYANISAAAKKYGMEGNYVAGANIAGFEKVLDAMNAQGIV